MSEETEYLNEQSWYDYVACINAIVQEDHSNNRRPGEIFMVKVARMTRPSDGPVHHIFWALKILDEGDAKDKYRMCLHKEPLEHQRTLRGINPPARVKLSWGHITLGPQTKVSLTNIVA